MTVQLRQNAETLAATSATPVTASKPGLKGGIARGTHILTAKGEVLIEKLNPGDRIITRERGMATLKDVTRVAAGACTIRSDSLGLARPECDTIVTECQHVAVRDWRAEALFDTAGALVPARRLADGKHIAASGEQDFYRLGFDAPLTVYANGLEVPTGRTEIDVIEITHAD